MKTGLLHIILVLMVFLTFNNLFSQETVQCFVNAGLTQQQQEINDPQVFSGQSLFPCQRVLSIHLHLVADTGYNYAPDSMGVELALIRLNESFYRSGISFRYCEIDSVENYKYNNFSIDAEIPEVKTMFYKAGVINVFVVEEITKSNINFRIEGHTFFPGGDDIIVITKEDFILYGLSHQMGHFFGIYHTYENYFGLENVNGVNCLIRGDLLCDTPADKIVPANLCNPGYVYTDNNGDKYHHPMENIMSAHIACRCVFSIAQMNKMVYNLLTYRSYLK